MEQLRIGLAQINSTVGDLNANAEKIIKHIKSAKQQGADIVIFPEMCLTGYPPEDLLLKPGFINDNLASLDGIVEEVNDITAIVGFIDRQKNIYNAAAIIHNKQLKIVHKIELPTYGVFDEARYFKKGKKPQIAIINGFKIGISICEDIWCTNGPAYIQAEKGDADLLINISASPYYHGKKLDRENMLSEIANNNSVPTIYANMVGGQDELIFDGSSLIINSNGEVIARAASFEEELLIFDLETDCKPVKNVQECSMVNNKDVETVFISGSSNSKKEKIHTPEIAPLPEPLEEIYSALVLGVKDYFKKNHFNKAVIGVSGGIDSAIVMAIAVNALGNENVFGIFMPSRYTSDESRQDAEELVDKLGVSLYTIPIDDLFKDYKKSLNFLFKNREEDKTEENLQARIRGNIMMATSNKFGWIVLTTGNKSEMSVGYATLYGDMAGGFAVIKDIYKTKVYKLSHYINKVAGKDIIPANILKKAPTAELRDNQTDQDSLPSYEVLDEILKLYIENDMTAKVIIESGFDKKLVTYITGLVDQGEYKRRQAPIGIKITQKAFGKDRRLPITNRYT